MNRKKLLPLVIATIIMTSCNTGIPEPKQPKSSNRVPVNKTIPAELEN